jgi:hypothetical protein
MPKKTYRVVHNGVEHTRKTDRTYTHVVLVRRDYQTELADTVKEARERARREHGYAVERANQPLTGRSWMTAEDLAEDARIAGLPLEQYEAEVIEKACAYVETRRAKGVFDQPGPLTWCGRPDLAAKEEANARKSGYWAEVVVVEVPQP